MTDTEKRLTLVVDADEAEVLRVLEFETRSTSTSDLLRQLLRESPQVQAMSRKLKTPTVFQERPWGGSPKRGRPAKKLTKTPA